MRSGFQNTLRRIWQIHSKHFSILIVITLFAWIILTRLAWVIVGKISGQDLFPGFTSLDIWTNILVNCAATIGTGMFMILPAFLFPVFRKNPVELLHIPIAFGIALFLLIFSVQIYAGLKI